jgi:ATP-binding cassette subfamily B protein
VARGVAAGLTWQLGAALAPLVLARAVDEGVVAGDVAALALWCAALAGLGAMESLAAVVRHRHAAGLFADSAALLRRQLLDRALELDPPFHDRVPAASLLTRASSDVEQVARLLDMVPHTVAYLVSVVGTGCLLALLDIRLAALVVGGVASLTFLLAWAAPRQRVRAAALQEAIDRVTVGIDETVTGLEVVKGVGAENARVQVVAHATAAVRERGLRIHRLGALVDSLLDAVPLLVLAATLLVGGRLALAHDLTVGELVAASAYVTFLAPLTRVLGERVESVQAATASAQRIADVLSARPTVTDPEQPVAVPDRRPLSLELVDVCFGYGETPVLDGVTLRIQPGERVAVVGRSGSGKSSLLRLLARHYDVRSGQVLVGDVDVRAIRLADLRSRVATVLEPALFKDTVKGAIRFGDPAARRGRVRQAARAAGAGAFVDALPEGYDHDVGEQGSRLSGGERQRLTLARALLPRASVLLLDDVTSSLDPATERLVLTSLRQSVDGATLVLATSRPSALSVVDRVLVLECGRVVADGTHAQLLRSCPLFRRLCAMPCSGAAEEGAGVSELASSRIGTAAPRTRPTSASEEGS